MVAGLPCPPPASRPANCWRLPCPDQIQGGQAPRSPALLSPGRRMAVVSSSWLCNGKEDPANRNPEPGRAFSAHGCRRGRLHGPPGPTGRCRLNVGSCHFGWLFADAWLEEDDAPAGPGTLLAPASRPRPAGSLFAHHSCSFTTSKTCLPTSASTSSSRCSSFCDRRALLALRGTGSCALSRRPSPLCRAGA